MQAVVADPHEHAWERVPRSWPPRFRCTVKRCAAYGRIQRDRNADASTWKHPQIDGWSAEGLRFGTYMQEIPDGT